MIRAALVLAVSLGLAAPAAAQQEIEHRGTYRHASADAYFPERVGDFVRSSLTRYDGEGRDVSGSYNLVRPEGRVVITVYVYPAPAVAPVGGGPGKEVAQASLCLEEFRGAQQAIANAYAGAAKIEEGSPVVAAVSPALSHRAVYRMRTRFDGVDQDVRSELDLYCYVGGDWLVKYRISSHLGFAPTEAIASFIRTGPWPGRPATETVASR